MKRSDRVIAVLFLGICFFISLLEIAARFHIRFAHKLINRYETLIEGQGFRPDNKQPNERRIFLLGQSAARGIPYPLELSTSSYLEKLLRSETGSNVRVINVRIQDTHSFHEREAPETLIRYGADAVILYTGNNETRDFSYTIRDVPFAYTDLKLTWNLRLWWGMKRKLMSLKTFINKTAGRQIFVINYNQDDVWHWTDTYLRKKRLYYKNPELAQKRKKRAMHDFEVNLSALVRDLKARGTKVYIASLPIVHERKLQIRDWPRKGYKFEQKILFHSAREEPMWKSLFEMGRDKVARGDFNEGIEFLEKARSINYTYPALLHELAKAYAGLKQYSLAKTLYVQAKDAQVQSPGGDSSKNNVLRRVTERFNVPLVDLQNPLETVAPNGILGRSLFHHHGLPNLLGHKVIAARLAQSLCEDGFILCRKESLNWKTQLERLIGGRLDAERLAQEYFSVALYRLYETSSASPPYEEAVEYLNLAREGATSAKAAKLLRNIDLYLAASYWQLGKRNDAKTCLARVLDKNIKDYRVVWRKFPYLIDLAQSLTKHN